MPLQRIKQKCATASERPRRCYIAVTILYGRGKRFCCSVHVNKPRDRHQRRHARLGSVSLCTCRLSSLMMSWQRLLPAGGSLARPASFKMRGELCWGARYLPKILEPRRLEGQGSATEVVAGGISGRCRWPAAS
jgi:hypothetical protein